MTAEFIRNGLYWRLLTVWLPLAAVAVATLWTVVLIRRDQYRRRLSLTPSPEEQRLRELVERGVMDAETASRLLASCAALPDVHERVPLPDLPLKLASVFGRVYSVVKIVMIAAVAATILTMRFWAQLLPESVTCTVHSEKLPLLLAGGVGVLILALGEFIAAVRILHGSIRARNFLIFSWLVNFLLIRALLTPFDSALFCVLTAGCGVYTLYVLLFRPGARRKIAADGGDSRRRGKVAVGLLAAVALTAGLTLFSAQSSQVCEMYMTWSNFFQVEDSSLHYEVEKLILIPGTPDAETARFCRLLAAGFRDDSGRVCEVRRFEEPVPVDDLLRTQALVVSRREDPPGSYAGILKNPISPWKSGPVPGGDFGRLKSGNWKRSYGFRIESAAGNHAVSYGWKGLFLTDNPSFFSGTVFTVTTDPGPARKSLERMAELVLKQWRDYREKQHARPRVKLPAYLETEATPFQLELDLAALPEAKPLFFGRGKHLEAVARYRFAPPRTPEAQQELIRALEAQGFVPDPQTAGGDVRRFTRGLAIALELHLPEPQSLSGAEAFRVFDGELLYRRARFSDEKVDLSFLRRFAADDPRACALLGGLRFLPEAERRKSFAALRREGALSQAEKLLIWTSLSSLKPLDPEVEDFFYDLAREVLDDFGNPDYLTRVDVLLTSTAKLPEKQSFLLERLAPIRERIELSALPEAEGLVSLTRRIRRVPWCPSRLLLELEVPGKPPLRVAAGLTTLPNQTVKVETGSSNTAGISRRELSGKWFQGNYIFLSRIQTWWRRESSVMELEPGRSPRVPLPSRSPEPGEVVFRLHFDEAASEYVIDVIWNPWGPVE